MHSNVQALGRSPGSGGWRERPRGPGDNRDRKHGSGYDCVNSLVDDHPRLADSEILVDGQVATCAAGFFRRAAAYFAACGIDRIKGVMTDDAPDYCRWHALAEAVVDRSGALPVWRRTRGTCASSE